MDDGKKLRSGAAWAAGLGLGAAASGAWAYATLYPQSQLCGPVLIALRRPGEIALTFDDGPNPEATPALLDLLARSGVRATFFLIGRFVREQAPLVRRIAAEGHALGNHTMTHPWLPLVSPGRAREEIRAAQEALEDVLGQPLRLFRPPHGARTPGVLRYARELGMTTVQWNVIAGDWEEDVTPEIIAGRVSAGVTRAERRGRAANIVLHDGGHTRLGEPRMRTVRAVELLLGRLHGRRFVTPLEWLNETNTRG